MGEPSDSALLSLPDSGLPPRVREIAAELLQLARADLADRTVVMLEHLESRMFRQAERARDSTEQVQLMKGVQRLKVNRRAFVERYFQHLESVLAQLRRPATLQAVTAAAPGSSSEWTVSTAITEEDHRDAHRRDLAAPLESAASLPLYLLGQRFGVLAASPPVAAAHLCMGPHVLIGLAYQTATDLFGESIPKDDLQSMFAQYVLGDYPGFVERLNLILDKAGVLPGLAYIPVKPMRASRTRNAASAGAEPTSDHDEPLPAHDGSRTAGTVQAGGGAAHQQPWPPATNATANTMAGSEWLEQPDTSPLIPPAQTIDFLHLQQLLTAQRIAGRMPMRPSPPPGAELGSLDIDRLLHQLQGEPPVGSERTRSIHGLRTELLQRARSEHGPQADLRREDADTFEILSILYGEVAREVRAGSSVHGLLERLQLPILRLALRDRAFFEKEAHPGRQLLNTIAEADATRYGQAAVDPFFEAAMHKAVERMEDEFHGQSEVLEQVNQDLQKELGQQVKRSQASEKRVVEAARGRERMAVAKQTAGTALQGMIGVHKPPRAIEVLLHRAWLDAMTLVALRNDEQSPAWRQMLDTTRRIMETVKSPAAVESTELAAEVRSAMERVGYHEAEATTLARHLSRSASAPREDDEPSATEISARIKAHARLGDEDKADRRDKLERAKLPPRNAQEEECYRHLRTLPFGCWIDFIQNQQGEAERRRLSWYSTITDKALFVNRRGQRVAEMHMDALARLMAQGQLVVVQREKMRLIDRAFRATTDLLRNTLLGAGPASGVRTA